REIAIQAAAIAVTSISTTVAVRSALGGAGSESSSGSGSVVETAGARRVGEEEWFEGTGVVGEGVYPVPAYDNGGGRRFPVW
ncbi:MAG: hypothetical protein ABI134_01675, partial [Byssovorax sp.]